MNKLIATFAGAVLALGLPAVAEAKNVVADPETIAAAMRDAGFRAEIDKLSDGSPFVQSSSGGLPFRVFFYGCNDAHTECKTMQLYAGFLTKKSPTLEEMNEYIRDNRFGRVYIDSEDDPVIEMDIDLEKGGMSPELFKDNLEYWEYVMGQFAKFSFGKD